MGGNLLAGMLGAGLLIAAAPPAAAKCNLTEVGQIPVSMEGLSPLVDATINGQPTRLVADSGAFFSLLSNQEAEKFKLKSLPERKIWVQGVSGTMLGRIEPVQEFGAVRSKFKNIDFVTVPESFGRGVSGLLGENFLSVTDTEYDLANGLIRFFHPDSCQDAVLAYWDPGRPYSVIPIHRISNDDRRTLGHVSVNGVELAGQFDTGTRYSVLSLHGAARIGIKKGDPRLKAGGVSSGLGQRLNQTWIAPVDSFKIGDEEIKNTGLRVGEFDLGDVDMLIGADFFLSHHIFVANSQDKLYLTYNGGPVFKLDVISGTASSDQDPAAADRAAPTTAANPAESSASAGDPTDADGFARRARASAARGDFARAFADFDRAVALAPMDPQILYARGLAYAADKRLKLALADLDEALRLNPRDKKEMLMSRGELHLMEKQPGLAKIDFDEASRWDRDLMMTIADEYFEEKSYPEALAEYDAYLARGEHRSAEKAAALGEKCFVRAVWNQNLDKAMEDCQAAQRLDARSRDILYSRGFLYLRLSRFADAIRDLDQVILSQPKLAFALYCRGLAKTGAGKADQGQADIKAAIAIDPGVVDRARKYELISESALAKP